MTVPESRRGESGLTVHQKADELAKYTLHITENDKVFDPRQAMLIGMLTESAVTIGKDLWMANNIYVRDAEDLKQRLGLQDGAALRCNELLYLIRISGPVFHLRQRRVGHWSAMTAEVRKLARGWRDKDAARYKKKLNL